MTKIIDIIDPKIKFQLMEDSSEVDGTHILAKVKGQFFVPDGKSRNGRYYPKELWEKVISNSNIKNLLEKRLMFGTVGHDAELGDKAIREGLVSHFMTKIHIDEKGQGIGEALVMNTPVGKILNTVLRAGSQLYVSSRANGSFKGKNEDGLPMVDPDNFELIGWDFVIDPGFLSANPSLAEQYNKIQNELKDNIGDGMPPVDAQIRLVEHITSENVSLKERLEKALSEVSELKSNNEELFNENKHLKAESAKLEDLEGFSELGTLAEVTEALNIADKIGSELLEYRELGSVKEIKKALELSYKEISESRTKFGTNKEIERAFELSEKFHAEVSKLGTLKEIKTAFLSFGKMMEEVDAQAEEKIASDLASELGIELEKVKELLAKGLSVEDIKAMHATVAEKFKKTAPVTKVEEKKVEEKKTNFKKSFEKKEDKKEEVVITESSLLGRSRAERLNEKFTRV